MNVPECEMMKSREKLINKSLMTYKTSVDAYAKENAALRLEVKRIQEELNAKTSKLNAIENATFWKITKPLRDVTDGIKKISKPKQHETAIEKNENRICINNYSDLTKKIHCFSENAEIYLENKLKAGDNQNGKSVLLFVHELSLTGAPVAMLHFAQELERQGYFPVIITPSKGRLIEQSTIPILIIDNLLDNCQFDVISDLFDIVVIGTIVGAPLIKSLMHTGTPTIWWIHEAETSYNVKEWIDRMPPQLTDNIHVYTGGEYAQKVLKQHRPLYYSENFLYYIPEVQLQKNSTYDLPVYANNKTVFAIIGLQEYRKGQDILAEAIRRLPLEYLKKSYFVFVGKECYKPTKDIVDNLASDFRQNILCIEELNKQELASLYKAIDCLICASRDDPMPIVVTEALQYGKMIICSENTGTAALLNTEQFGMVYAKNSSVDLKDSIIRYLDNPYGYNDEAKAKNIYNKYFSQKVFEKKASEVIQKSLYPLKRPVKNVRNTIKNILLVSHELSLTGAPIALYNLAKILVREGYHVDLISPYDGALKKEFQESQIRVYVEGYGSLFGENSYLNHIAYNYDFIILNTVVTYRAVSILGDSGIPVMWWIHDSFASYSKGGFANIMPSQLPSNVQVFCGSEYARRALLSYYPNYIEKTDLLNYYLPDMSIKHKEAETYALPHLQSDKTIFALFAQQDERKGQDVLAEAICSLPEDTRNHSIFYFVGRRLDQNIYDSIQKVRSLYPNIVYCIDEIPHEQLFSVYEQCDCIICSSKDDPLPVFVAEAMMMSKIIICSENTGMAPIIKRGECGIVYRNNDFNELAQAIEKVVTKKAELGYMQVNARKTYIDNFNEDHFRSRISGIIEKIEGGNLPKPYVDKRVSVVVPTYNPGHEIETLCNRILNQKLVKKVELIIVDSGSKDGSLDIADKLGAMIIKIPHEEFSHSYARNLGALHAKGDIIVFMTQDALPSSPTWLSDLCEPLLSGAAVASSCNEINPGNTEVFYKVSTCDYAAFRGIDNGKRRINYKNEHDDKLELRKKASLTDVSTAIVASVFKEFYYRYDYAEDLDLGIRLLNNGYRIALLGNVGSIHGHNRPASYYLKRNYVEISSFCTILDEPNHPEEDWVIASKSLSVCEAVFGTFYQINKNKIKNCVIDEYIRQLKKYLFETRHKQFLELDKWDCSYADSEMTQYFDLYKQMCQSIEGDYSLINNVLYYLDNSLIPYLKAQNLVIVDSVWRDTINTCITKHLAGVLGAELARIKPDSPFYDLVSGMTAGV